MAPKPHTDLNAGAPGDPGAAPPAPAAEAQPKRKGRGKAAPKSSHQGPDERAPTTSQPHP